MLKTLRKIFTKCKLIGFSGIFKCLLKKIYINILWLFYNFDRWHVSSIFECRTYKSIVVNAVNKLNPKTVVELGCGLGEIISRINSINKFGIDIDQKIINAAKCLYGKRGSFYKGGFDKVISFNQDNIDVLVMCNWIHNICQEELRSEIHKLLNRKTIRYIIADSIEEMVIGYRYKHNIGDLFNGIAIIKEVSDDGGEKIRKIYSLEVI